MKYNQRKPLSVRSYLFETAVSNVACEPATSRFEAGEYKRVKVVPHYSPTHLKL